MIWFRYPHKRSIILLALMIILLSLLACANLQDDHLTPTVTHSEAVKQPKGNRLLGISVNTPENNDYDQAFQLAQSVGIDFISLSVAWDDIEIAPYVYEPDPNWLAIANTYYSITNTALDLVIAVIDTTNLRIPDDLADIQLNDPAMVERFKRTLDYVSQQLPNVEVQSLAIGNEIDIYLGTDETAWEQFEFFFEQTSQYARSLFPGVLVGTKITYSGLMGFAQTQAESINRYSNAVMVTYYPLNSDHFVLSPEVVHSDFKYLVSSYPQHAILISEIGYPTSSELRSSEDLQAQFIREAFFAWDTYSENIMMLNFVWLTEISNGELAHYADYYNSSDERFLAFLGSLGLRHREDSGRHKPGFEALLEEALARGW